MAPFHPSRRLSGRLDFLRGQPQPIAWRLAIRDETRGRGFCLPDVSGGWRGRRAQHRLGSYIAAGGMRDMRPARNADRDTSRRQIVVTFTLALLAFWVVFQFVPCS